MSKPHHVFPSSGGSARRRRRYRRWRLLFAAVLVLSLGVLVVRWQDVLWAVIGPVVAPTDAEAGAAAASRPGTRVGAGRQTSSPTVAPDDLLAWLSLCSSVASLAGFVHTMVLEWRQERRRVQRMRRAEERHALEMARLRLALQRVDIPTIDT